MLQWSWCTITSPISLKLGTVLSGKGTLAAPNLFRDKEWYCLPFCCNYVMDLLVEFKCNITSNKKIDIKIIKRVLISLLQLTSVYLCHELMWVYFVLNVLLSIVNIHYQFDYDLTFCGIFLLSYRMSKIDMIYGDESIISTELTFNDKLCGFGSVATDIFDVITIPDVPTLAGLVSAMNSMINGNMNVTVQLYTKMQNRQF